MSPPNSFQAGLSDETTGNYILDVGLGPNVDTSAVECMVEDPNGGDQYLMDFGSITFQDCIGSPISSRGGIGGMLSFPGNTPLWDMFGQYFPLAEVGDVSLDGRFFTVYWDNFTGTQ